MSFDILAPYYRAMELMLAGPTLQRSRTAHLATLGSCRHALLLGEGPGRFLTELLARQPRVRVTCVEQSAGMIAVARRQLASHSGAAQRVEFVHADALSWKPGSAQYDLVVTNFFLDCFQPREVAALIAKVSAHTTQQASWLLADFQIPDRGWQKWRAQIVVGLMYRFFRWVTGLSATSLTAADVYLRAAGFDLRARRTLNFQLIHADHWSRTAI